MDICSKLVLENQWWWLWPARGEPTGGASHQQRQNTHCSWTVRRPSWQLICHGDFSLWHGNQPTARLRTFLWTERYCTKFPAWSSGELAFWLLNHTYIVLPHVLTFCLYVWHCMTFLNRPSLLRNAWGVHISRQTNWVTNLLCDCQGENGGSILTPDILRSPRKPGFGLHFQC